jgi:hypothetical protein
VTKLDDFLTDFARLNRHRNAQAEKRPFALILGAGASRSAGIPLASEMIRALRLLARANRHEIPATPADETEWSWVFRQVLSAVAPDRPFADRTREFVVECISRAWGEANVSHFLAAALTNGGIFRYIVTTNFDDQALAGFWSLPRGEEQLRYIEPHVIYDAAAGPAPNIAARVPIIVKAHGHHTTYGLGVLDRDIDALAPPVQEMMHRLPVPGHGFLVVGYSGQWNDGIMRAFADKTFMKGKAVYWFFAGPRPPAGPWIDAAKAAADVKFIRIADSDDLFLRLWDAVEANVHNDHDGRDTLLFPAELFTFSTAFRIWMPGRTVTEKEWWYPPSDWPNKKLAALRKRLLPVLRRDDAQDDERLPYECLPESLKNRFAMQVIGIGGPQFPHSEWLEMFKLLPTAVPWTRRNRKLVIRALSDRCPAGVRYRILEGLSRWGFW